MHKVIQRVMGVLGACVFTAGAAEPLPDFALADLNKNSPRGTNLVSPRDYTQQVSAYFFAAATCGICRSQMDYLNTMQNELRTARTPVNIEILRVNQIGADSSFYISVVTAGRTMPLLQDTPEVGAWTKWGVAYRDVWILDSSNRVVGVYNLTANDLANPEARATLKQMLLDAAALADADADGLPDHWENQFVKTMAQGKNDDPDGDRVNNFAEFALGTDPLSRWSRPEVQTSINDSSRFTITFKRWGGTLANYLVEGSTDLQSWNGSDSYLRTSSRNLYDGTGRFEVTYSFQSTVVTQPFGFLRLQAEPLE